MPDAVLHQAITALGSVGSLLDNLTDDQLAQVLDGATIYIVAAAALVFPLNDGRPHVGILLEGMARAYLGASDGRQFTIRYARPGAMIGTRSLVSGDHAPVRVQALTRCKVIEINRNAFLKLADTEANVAAIFIDELSERIRDLYDTVADTAFASLRQQVARHLLLLAQVQRDGLDAAEITQQQLADAVGSTREVVARTLRSLRAEGLVQTGTRRIVLLDRDRLRAIVGTWLTAPI
ncbi:MAG TPA: Crp/Fnr family transcriptional regulator [Candidatus Limnocylindrales bacterium]|nr:Crp/Fnr family transcriptional regulator [Candidatus Limnocylindrales bacterium]